MIKKELKKSEVNDKSDTVKRTKKKKSNTEKLLYANKKTK
jgi:hypothetical protein